MNIVDLRHHLHENPELSGKEQSTAKIISRYLEKYLADSIYSNVGGNGVIAVFKGNPRYKSIAFRADIDALPMTETGNPPYRSINPEAAHSCGHDGHTAILLDFASKIAINRNKIGDVILIFQPAEETGSGAAHIIKSGLLQELKPTAIFGMHNLPGYLTGSIELRRGTFASASCGLIIKLHGLEAHAAYPEFGINPGSAVADIINFIEKVNISHRNLDDFQQITLIYSQIGKVAFGTSAGDAEIMLTLRAFKNSTMKELINEVQNFANTAAKNHKLKIEFEFRDCYNALENTDECVNVIDEAAEELELKKLYVSEPRRWSEDFADYLLGFPGAFFGIGAGPDHLPLHHPGYDFPDEIIETGSNMFLKIAEIASKL